MVLHQRPDPLQREAVGVVVDVVDGVRVAHAHEREAKVEPVKLRKKLDAASGGQNYIETVWGRGYVLREPEDIRESA